MDRMLFSEEKYSQAGRGDYCVLASYGVAMKPLLEGAVQDVIDFFKAYCDEMKLAYNAKVAGQSPEEVYLRDFYDKTEVKRVISGYQLIEHLHKNATASLFTAAMAKVDVEHFGLPHDLRPIEAALKDTTKRVIATVFVNQKVRIPALGNRPWDISSHHSITVSYDRTSFYIYDVNHGQGVIGIGMSLSVLGSGDCLLFTKKENWVQRCLRWIGDILLKLARNR